MTNPFDMTYLLSADPRFGPFAWIFFILQVAGVVAGVYLTYFREERNALRRALLRQLGIALMILCGIGVLLGLLRLSNVPVFNQRYWFYLQLLIQLGVAGYIFYYVRYVYPGLVAQSQVSARGKGGARRAAPARTTTPPTQNGSAGSAAPPRPAASTGRREARRDRKRKNR